MPGLTSEQKLHLKHLIKELKVQKALHTEFVSVYIPVEYDLVKIINHLAEEQGTASNIKSAVTRKNVQMALEKMIQHLRLFKKTPPNGLAVFTGNVAAIEGKEDLRVWSIEPPVPLNVRIYRCDKNFVTDILEEMLADKEVYGLVVLDHRDATLALLRGKTITVMIKTHSEVPGKMRAGGQCLLPDTLVQSCDGNIISIKDSHNPFVLKSASWEKSELSESPITDKWETKKPQVYKIITKFPRLIVESSKDHTFFISTLDGIKEKTAEKLNISDCLVMPEQINIKGEIQLLDPHKYYNAFAINEEGRKKIIQKRKDKRLLQRELAKKIGLTQTTISFYEIGKLNPERESLRKICEELGMVFKDFLKKYTAPSFSHIELPERLDENFAQFLGYLIGDGCLEQDRVTFFEQDKQVALSYKKKYDLYFKYESSYRFRDGKNYHQLRFTSRPLVRLILGEFIEISRKNKTLAVTIPEKILKSPNKVLAVFLRGLFDAEGYVSGRKVGFGINNKMLAQQVQMTLLRFGILSSLLEYDNRKNQYSNKMRYTLEISERKSLEQFEQNIGFTGNTKTSKLKELINHKSNRGYVRQLIVSGREIRKIIEKAGYNLQLFPKVTNFFRNERMMSKEVFRNSILACVKDAKLKHELKKIVDIPFLPVQINKIEITERETEMVDISVKNQNFIANGLIVHNSAPRFARARELANKEHYKKIANYMKEQFLPLGNNLQGIIIGGPGVTVNDFMNHDYLTGDIKKKIIGTKDLSYTDEYGLQELLDKSTDLLEKEEVAREMKIMERFFKQLLDNPGKVTYGEKETLRALEMNAVDVLLVSESLEEEKVLEWEEKAQKGNSEVRIISVETREGVQLREMGGVAAILRYEIG